MAISKIRSIYLLLTIFLILNPVAVVNASSQIEEKLFGYVEQQLNLGNRIPGTEGSERFKNYIRDFTENTTSWRLTFHNFTYMDTAMTNLLITKSTFGNVVVGSNDSYIPKLLIGAHFDSRARATKDTEFPELPVPGANDAASGVAVILGLMEALDGVDVDVGFILFDGEDQGYDRDYGMDGWGWIRGSTAFAEALSTNQVNQIGMFLLLDMIGDKDLQIKKERNSNSTLNDMIWDLAHDLGYSAYFQDSLGYGLIDDHVPFIRRGIPSVDLIDFDFPFHHTVKDDLESVSGASLSIVYEVVLSWIDKYLQTDSPLFSTSKETNFQNSSNLESANASFIFLEFILIVYFVRRKFHSKT